MHSLRFWVRKHESSGYSQKGYFDILLERASCHLWNFTTDIPLLSFLGRQRLTSQLSYGWLDCYDSLLCLNFGFSSSGTLGGANETLERLLTYPIDVKKIVLGDIIASSIFRILLSAVPLAIAFGVGVSVNPLIILGIVVSAVCFSSLGLLFSAYPSNIPATVMMISVLVRFPMTFISGIFIPIDNLPEFGKSVSLSANVFHRHRKVLRRIRTILLSLHGLCRIDRIHAFALLSFKEDLKVWFILSPL